MAEKPPPPTSETPTETPPAPPPPSPPSVAAPSIRPAPAPDPQPNPLASRNPPPPSLPKRKPGRPTKVEAAARAQASPPATTPPPQPDAPKVRELPEDPAARASVLAEVRPTAEMILAVLDVAASRLPPKRSLSDAERAAIGQPLEVVLFRRGGNITPEWSLAIAIVAVAFGRFVEVKGASFFASDATPEVKAA